MTGDTIAGAATVKLKRSDYERILEHARAGLPNEVCGLIAGTLQAGVKTVEHVYLCTNVDESDEHFSIDPREQLAALKDARSKGWRLLGNWHSHPETPSRQSEEDRRLSYDHSASYLILSLAQGEPVLNSFHFDGVESTKENLVIA